jgi:cold-inducible RNA-binding protein
MSLSKNIYVGNLPFNATADDLREAFANFGTVTRAQIVSDRDTGRSRGFGFVEMSEGGDQAIANLNGAQYGGRTLTVNEAKPREDRPRSSSSGGGRPSGGRGGYGGGGGGGGYGGRY